MKVHSPATQHHAGGTLGQISSSEKPNLHSKVFSQTHEVQVEKTQRFSAALLWQLLFPSPASICHDFFVAPHFCNFPCSQIRSFTWANVRIIPSILHFDEPPLISFCLLYLSQELPFDCQKFAGNSRKNYFCTHVHIHKKGQVNRWTNQGGAGNHRR